MTISQHTAQLGAVRGTRLSPDPGNVIAARSANLRDVYRRKEEDALTRKALDLEERRLAQGQAQSEREIGLAEEDLTLRKKALGDSDRMEMLNLGLMAFLGLSMYDGGGGTLGNANPVAKSPGDGIFSMESLGAGAVGGLAGQAFGEDVIPIGGKTEQGAIMGGLTGGTAAYLMTGGDPYITAAAAILGAVGGGLDIGLGG